MVSWNVDLENPGIQKCRLHHPSKPCLGASCCGPPVSLMSRTSGAHELCAPQHPSGSWQKCGECAGIGQSWGSTGTGLSLKASVGGLGRPQAVGAEASGISAEGGLAPLCPPTSKLWRTWPSGCHIGIQRSPSTGGWQRR